VVFCFSTPCPCIAHRSFAQSLNRSRDSSPRTCSADADGADQATLRPLRQIEALVEEALLLGRWDRGLGGGGETRKRNRHSTTATIQLALQTPSQLGKFYITKL